MINKLAEDIHKTAIEKGWWDSGRSDAETLMMIVCEVAECVEALRKGHESEAEEELNDIIIRALDFAAYKGWDPEAGIIKKHEYNKTREHKHGKLF